MQFQPVIPFALAVLALGATLPESSRPDEGMWPFDSLPLKQLKEKYDFEPTKEWLDHVRLGSVRFDTGGSGSFVSANGLVMTNHHVALETIQKISTPEKDWVEPGFSARLYGKEVPGTDLVLRQLVDVKDVTDEVMAVKADGGDVDAKLAEICEGLTKPDQHLEAQPVSLYDGNQFRAYVYHVYDDVRLVFAPAKQVAFYGGDFDNFTYPRWCLDCAFFRVYEDGKPVDSSKWFFQFETEGANKDDLVFVSGHPGGTERSLTYDEMVMHRELWVPQVVALLTNNVRVIKQRMEQSEEEAFRLRDNYFGQMNSLKAFTGHLNGLLDEERMALIKARDEELIEKSGKEEVAAAFAAIKEEMEKLLAKHAGERVNFQLMRRDMQKATEAVAEHKTVINKARFDVYGDANYPDATFTLRLAYGTVKGYEAGTTKVPPKTTVHGLYERNAAFDNEHPFDLPQQWLDAKGKLDWDTPYNFVSTCDIIGGNSGSPILDRDAKVVGLVFDGNIESLPGNYWFDEEVNRCVGVHTAIMVEALDKVYEEKALLKELMGSK
ncbi:MAG: S46 family peptidase [Planctomycetes bacterium]|nr:S46 family peptidase [Planctomycetota bacterium]